MHGTTKFLIPKNVQIQTLNTQIYLLFKPFTVAREYYQYPTFYSGTVY